MSDPADDMGAVDESVDETTSTALRWQYTNDLIAGGYLLAFVVLTGLNGAGLISLTVLPTAWRIAAWTIALTAAAWAFGGAALKAAASAVKR